MSLCRLTIGTHRNGLMLLTGWYSILAADLWWGVLVFGNPTALASLSLTSITRSLEGLSVFSGDKTSSKVPFMPSTVSITWVDLKNIAN